MTIHITTEEDKGKCLIERAREEGRRQGLEEARQIALKEAEECEKVAKMFVTRTNEHNLWHISKCTASIVASKIKQAGNQGSLQDSAGKTDNKEKTL